MHPARLAAFRSAHIDGVAEQDFADFALLYKLFQRIQVGSLSRSHQVRQALRGDAERVAHSQPDPPLPQIQGQDASVRGSQFNFIIDGGMLHSSKGCVARGADNQAS
jgi:hypothetical protein